MGLPLSASRTCTWVSFRHRQHWLLPELTPNAAFSIICAFHDLKEV